MTIALRLPALLSCVPLVLAGAACASPDADAPFDMAAYLEEAAAGVDPVRNRFANSALLEAMEALPARTNERDRLLFRLAMAEQTLYAGRLEAAIELLESLRTDLAEHQASVPAAERAPASFLESLLDYLAAAYLRLGELENCIDGMGAVACLVPAPAEAVHTAPRGALASIPIYEELLDRNPDNLGARWMLNVAHMMVGTYPRDVPDAYRIPELAFRSEHDIGRFRDVAPALGVDDVGHVGGAVMDDFNGDGLLDLMASSWQLRDPIRYHLNRGDGTFESFTGAAGLEGLWGGGNLVQADYDNDGDLDVFVLRGGWLVEGQVNSLLRNRGDGTFEDVTEQAGLLWPAHPSQTASWADFDGDGLLDLFVGNETFGDRTHPCQLFRNNGDGTFVDIAQEAGVAITGIVKGVTWGDYDNDGRPDLYISRINASNLLLHNDGPGADGVWSFSDRTSEAGVAEPRDAFPTWFWDYDNDGWLDIFVAGYRTNFGDIAAEYLGLPHASELPRLYRNGDDGTYEEVSEAV
ncbi:MAG: VCBS repeat-containing protein, partial [Chloroflexi bacterium]|nr:VCBS repeat-containing protein [Chloroflexota bacterium]